MLAVPGCALTNTNLGGGSEPPKLSMAPDGGPAWAVACTRSVSECYDECARVCPWGYKIIDKNQEGYVSRSRANGGDGWASAHSNATVDRISMLITCRPGSAGRMESEEDAQ